MFLKRIVTYYGTITVLEKWMHMFDPETLFSYFHYESHSDEICSQLSVHSVLHYTRNYTRNMVARRTTINGEYYATLLGPELYHSVKRKRP